MKSISMRKALVVVPFLAICFVSKAQKGNPYDILAALSEKMNIKYPILDSLIPLHSSNVGNNDSNGLTRGEKREFRIAVRHASGFRLISDSLKEWKLLPALPILKVFENFDSAGSVLIEKQKPFYMISNPIFLRQGKVIVNVNLIRGYGYTYILEWKNGKWAILKEIYNWM
jgi:hypothetical protein